MSCEVVTRDLDAYVDRELDPEASAVVREHVRTCSACGRQLAEREALGKLVRSAPYYAAPERLRARVAAQTSRSMSMRRSIAWAAAAVVVLAVGGGIVALRPISPRVDTTANEVVDGHVRSLMAHHLFDVESTDLHTVKPWFLGKLDFSPPVIDLAAIGFPLIGGRLDYVGGHPAAALVYQRQKHTINVFIFPESEDSSGRGTNIQVRGFNIRRWMRDGMSFWAVSDLNVAELSQFVEALQSR
jgi:anti-sigma factor (TIGR02949 family)